MGHLRVPLLGILTRALLIANPASRRGGTLVEEARQAILDGGATCDVMLTERAGHAGELTVMHGRNYDVVFALGGDGTAMEVAGSLAGSGVPIGVLPGGTGNLLARALGIPRHVARAVPALLHGGVRRIDLYVARYHREQVQETWYEKLQRWEDAVDTYEIKALENIIEGFGTHISAEDLSPALLEFTIADFADEGKRTQFQQFVTLARCVIG